MNALGVLFDFDGVIVDSVATHLKAWDQAHQEIFKVNLTDEDYRQLSGRSTAYIASFLAGRQGQSFRSEKLTLRKQELALDLVSSLRLLPGATSFITRLHQDKTPFGIVSNASRGFIAATLKHCQLAVPFFFGIEDYKRPKPNPDPYIKGARQLPIKFPDYFRIICFEDSTHGLDAAKRAFLTPVGICSQHPAEVLRAAGARRTYLSLAEALDDHVLDWDLTRQID